MDCHATQGVLDAWQSHHLDRDSRQIRPASGDQDRLHEAATPSRRPGAKLEVSLTTELPEPVALNDLTTSLAARHRSHLVEEGQQPAATGRALLDALVSMRPDAEQVINRIRAGSDGYRIRSTADEDLAVQRNGVLGLTRMSSMPIPQLVRWDPPAEELYDDRPPRSYIDLLSQTGMSPADTDQGSRRSDIAIEDHQIGRDAETFLGWIGEQTGRVAWRNFRQGGQSLLIANVNRTVTERNSGADLLYCHQDRGCSRPRPVQEAGPSGVASTTPTATAT